METNGSNNTCVFHDEYKFYIYVIIFSLVFVIGLIGNLIALFVFVYLTPQRTALTVFLTNLAMSDLCFVLLLPLRIYYYTIKNWPFGDIFCRITYCIFYVNMYSSIFFLMGISIFRYLAIVHPIRSRNFSTPHRAIISCVVIWLFVILVSSPFLQLGEHQVGNATRCFEPHEKNFETMKILNDLALIVGLFVPFMIIIFCYISIINVLQRRKKNVVLRQRTLRMIAITLVVFGLCFIPYHIQRTLYIYISSYHPTDCELRLTILDPFIYFFLSKNFRNLFCHVLHKSVFFKNGDFLATCTLRLAL
uniref:Cysteinyl leukotriene receptor 3 n=1 Tax=Eptatretus burgeri TaxID=7764 RepID=A0A8C4Q2F2_EPTBU